MPKKINLNANGRLLLNEPIEANGRTQFRARLVKAGRIRMANGEPGPFTVPPEAIHAAIQAGLFNGLAVFLDHPAMFDHASVKALVGVTHSATINEETLSADATIRLYTNGGGEEVGASHPAAAAIAATLQMILDDQAEGIAPPDIGISLVFWPTWETREDRKQPLALQSFKKIDSADIVFSPAADGRILQRLSSAYQTPSGGTNPMDPEEQEIEHSPKPNPPVTAAAPPPPTLNNINQWETAAAEVAGRQIIVNSSLPGTAKDKLLRQRFSSPDAVYAAITAEEEYLAALAANDVIQLPGYHPRGAGHSAVAQIFMKTPLDLAGDAVDYMFGVSLAPVPEPFLRNPANLYGALTGDYSWYGRFNPERTMFTGADTATLANMAADSMNKVIAAQLALLTFYRWYEHIAVPTPNDGSLHDMDWISFGGISTLPVVPEKGSYGELDVDDVKETDPFTKYGGYVGITREMLRKSEIQRIQAIPRALAAAAVKTRSAKIASIFTQASGVGPTLDQDSTVLFHSNHSNVATTALGTDLVAWRAAALECFKHTEVNSGDRIGVYPKFLLVPPDLYFQALANFGYGEGFPTTYLPEAQVHELRNNADPRPVPIPVPHFTDANDWAYITDPIVWPVIHISYSQDPSGRGHPAPELFSVASETAGLMFTNDVLPIKIRDEFAYGVNGHRGIGKRNVT